MHPPLSRREFLARASAAAAALAAAPALPAAPATNPLFGTQLYGWGQYYAREGRDLNANLDEVLSAVRDLGFDYAEHSLDSGKPEDNARFAERLRAKGLRPVSLYTGGRLHEPDKAMDTVARLAAAAKAARTAGFEVLVCNPDPIGRAKTDDELRAQAAALKALGTELNAAGMRLA
ncbi:MAG: twin-arginine translocation signal domain-containing protein, partial [Limisphaerales bacterium]